MGWRSTNWQGYSPRFDRLRWMLLVRLTDLGRVRVTLGAASVRIRALCRQFGYRLLHPLGLEQ
jgi:hypothetical protein